jgi:hypothetical protein
LQAKKVAKKQYKTGNFTIDATTPVTDEIFDIAGFVCLPCLVASSWAKKLSHCR